MITSKSRNTRHGLATAAAVVGVLTAFATAAGAGECPADKRGVDLTKPSTMASSSAELNACAPCALRRSLGRSVRGNSRILSLFGAFCRAPAVSGDGEASGTVEPRGWGRWPYPSQIARTDRHRFDAETISRCGGSYQQSENPREAALRQRGVPRVEADGRWLMADGCRRSLQGFACYGPTMATDRTYDLYWIAVDRAAQGSGCGSLLLTEVERRLEALHARMLVVETSSRSDYAATREFYLKRGYIEAARAREFYAPADDRIILTKRLAGSPREGWGAVA